MTDYEIDYFCHAIRERTPETEETRAYVRKWLGIVGHISPESWRAIAHPDCKWCSGTGMRHGEGCRFCPTQSLFEEGKE